MPPQQQPPPSRGQRLSAFGWTCRRCTFYHHSRGTRCVMCGELRSGSRQDCIDFVLGKQIPKPPLEGMIVEIKSPPNNGDDADNDQVSQDGGKNETDHCNVDQQQSVVENAGKDGNSINETIQANESLTNKDNQLTKEPNQEPTMPFAPVEPKACQGVPAQPQINNPYAKAICTNNYSAAANNNKDNNHWSGDNTRPDRIQNPFENHSQQGQNTHQDNATVNVANNIASHLQGQHNTLNNAPRQESDMKVQRQPNQPDSQLTVTHGHPNHAHVHPQNRQNGIQRPHQQQQQKMPPQNIAPVFDSRLARTGLQYGRGRRLSLVREKFHEGPVPINEENAKEWIYPVNENFPERKYQFEIAETALEYNTLVSLPTGLGKTHIAAVVMYNFWRWFAPEGKVVFCAPTVPLVRQQVEACYSITGIPPEDTCIMTGKSMRPKDRRRTWEQKRVFYCTPQTIQKDLEACQKEAEETGESGRTTFASQVVCLVLDEAHRTTGKYAYVKVIELLESIGAKFRIVGLSATPGTNIKAVQSVLESLRTTRIQVRTDDDESVKQYLHEKQEEVVICPRNDVQGDVERRFTDLLCPLLNRLREAGIFRSDGNATMTAFLIHKERERYTQLVKQQRISGWAYPLFAAAHKLASVRHDIRQSLRVVERKLHDIKRTSTNELKKIASSPEFESLLDCVTKAISEDKLVDPKLTKLKEELIYHFEKKKAVGESSKAIVFVNSRDTVQVIVEYLEKYSPLIKPRHFIGQSNGTKSKVAPSKTSSEVSAAAPTRLDGMAQKEQEKVIKRFKDGLYNVLVCTSIGEEGLDIGEVDLIVSYDIIESPTRNIQRAGRTGRKRDGRVICLVAQGDDEKKYRRQKEKEKTIQRALAKSEGFQMAVHRPMLQYSPICVRKSIDLSQFHMSQVVGSSVGAQQYTTGNNSKKRRRDKDYRLASSQEEERQLLFGDVVILDPQVTLKRLQRALFRSPPSFSVSDLSKRRKTSLAAGLSKRRRTGRSMKILKHLERFGSTRVAHGRHRDVDIQKVFPMHSTAWEKGDRHCLSPKLTVKTNILETDQKEKEPYKSRSLVPHRSAGPSDLTNISAAGYKDRSEEENSNHSDFFNGESDPPREDTVHDQTTRKPNEYEPLENAAPCNTTMVDERTRHENEMDVFAAETLRHDQPSTENCSFRLPTPPPSSQESSDDESCQMNGNIDKKNGFDSVDMDMDNVAETEDGAANLEENSSNHEKGTDIGSSQRDTERTAKTTEPKECCGPLDVRSNQHGEKNCFIPRDEVGFGFQLPTQESSSSSSEGESEDEVQYQNENGDCDKTKYFVEAAVSGNSNVRAARDEGDTLHQDVLKRSPGQASSDTDEDDLPLEQLRGKADVGCESIEPPEKENVSCNMDSCDKPHDNQHELTHGSSHANHMPKSSAASQEVFVSAVSRPKRRRMHIESDEDDDGDDIECIQDSHGKEARSQSLQAKTPTSRASSDEKLSALEDTPSTSDAASQRNLDGTFQYQKMADSNALTDTPCTDTKAREIKVKCDICGGDDVEAYDGNEIPENALIICHGCDVAVHDKCYAANVDCGSSLPWLCDLCQHNPSKEEIKCIYCSKSNGSLKRLATLEWCHPVCHIFSEKSMSATICSASCQKCTSAGGIRCEVCQEAMHPMCALDAGWTIVHVQKTPNDIGLTESQLYCPAHAVSSEFHCGSVRIIGPRSHLATKEGHLTSKSDKTIDQAQPKKLVKKSVAARKKSSDPTNCSDEVDKSKPTDGESSSNARANRRQEFQRRRGQVASLYFMEEADIDSQDDNSGDENEELLCRQMEDDGALSQDSFINDNDVLTQHASQDDLDAADPYARHHRSVDAKKERENLFATPLLNRGINSGEDRLSLPSSDRAIGQMHFVRSLMAHARDGGDVNEVEATYQRLAENGTQWSPSASQNDK